jgi:hypothetical protein
MLLLVSYFHDCLMTLRTVFINAKSTRVKIWFSTLSSKRAPNMSLRQLQWQYVSIFQHNVATIELSWPFRDGFYDISLIGIVECSSNEGSLWQIQPQHVGGLESDDEISSEYGWSWATLCLSLLYESQSHEIQSTAGKTKPQKCKQRRQRWRKLKARRAQCLSFSTCLLINRTCCTTSIAHFFTASWR